MDRILAAVDFTDTTEDVILMTKKLAGSYNSRVMVIHTEAPFKEVELESGNMGGPEVLEVVDEGEFAKDEAYLKQILKQLKDAGIQAECQLIKGPTIDSIIKAAESFNADLIIAGTHQQGAMYELFAANTAEQLARQSSCPIMIVPHKS